MATVCNQTHDAMMAELTYNLETLPEIRFDPAICELSCSINAILDDITVHSNDFRTIKDGDALRYQTVLTAVATQYERLKKCPEHVPYFTKLDNVANNLGKALLNVFNILQNNIKPEVDDLKNKISEEAAKSLESIEVIKNNEIRSGYDVFNWDEYFDKFGGQEAILGAIKDKFNYKPAFSDTDIRILITDPSMKPENVNVDEETEDAIRKMNEDTELNRVITNSVLGNNFGCHAELIRLLRQMFNSNDIVGMHILLKRAAEYKRILDNIDVSKLNVLDSLRVQISTNIDAIYKLLDFVVYATMIARKRLADVKALVLDKDTLNGDFVEEFTAAGNTFEDISKHIRIRYLAKNRNLPGTGIRIGEITENKESVNKQFTADTAAQQLRISRATFTAMSRAMELVLTQYLEGVDESRLPTGMNVNQFARAHRAEVRSCVGKLDTSSDNNLEDLLYRFVIDLWYKNTPVASAHKLFGEEVIRQLSINPSLEQQDLDLIDVSVAAAIAADFLMKNFIIIK